MIYDIFIPERSRDQSQPPKTSGRQQPAKQEISPPKVGWPDTSA
ncbi:hypothetical protein P9847_18330 [Paenibacillus chibensis]|uniref:Uncharacterized protein n=1 Tax=Paenibacillus chibensis TaxID=59846 RepID=A0ABU6PYW4_9BACL|nr:hypothetical protein [Paenibacillus chibensis]